MPGRLLVVDVERQQAVWLVDGQLAGRWPVSTARAGVGGTEGALKVTATGAGLELNSTVTLGSDATFNNTVRVDHGGTITDGASSFTLTKKGAGQHRPQYDADFAHLVIAEGEYELAGNFALPADTVTVNTGARLDIWRGLNLTQAGHTPTVTFNDGSTFNWQGNNAADVATIDGAMVLNGNVDFETGGTGNQLTIASEISGTGALTIVTLGTGSGSMLLSGNNTYSATTTIGDGTTAPGAITIFAGATTGLSPNSAFTVTANSTLKLNSYNNFNNSKCFNKVANSKVVYK